MHGERDRQIVCVIPRGLEDRLRGRMQELFAKDRAVIVISDRRITDRRSGSERRASPRPDGGVPPEPPGP